MDQKEYLEWEKEAIQYEIQKDLEYIESIQNETNEHFHNIWQTIAPTKEEAKRIWIEYRQNQIQLLQMRLNEIEQTLQQLNQNP